MNLLITGCGRSGTKYISEILKAGGLDIGHERIGEDGMASWYAAATGTRQRRQDCFPFHGFFTMKKNPIVWHQTRHPLDTIASVYKTFGKEAWDYIRWYLPQVYRKDSLLLMAMKYWLYWNRIAESKAHYRYKVEDIKEKPFILELCRKLKIKFTQSMMELLIPTRQTRNKKACKRISGIKDVTLEYMRKEDKCITQRIIHQGRRYGYQI